METSELEKTSEEIRLFLQDAEAPAMAGEEELPYESLDDFSTLPVKFEEQTAVMLERAEDLFVLTQRYNRHSKKYLEACGWLEKSISGLGSACVTRIAMKLDGEELPMLRQLSTKKLFGMASFNFRKINAAIEEDLRAGGEFPLPLMGMLIRYNRMIERLRSTEQRIWKINNREISAYDIQTRARTFSEKSLNRYHSPKQDEAPEYRQALSYPVISSAVREAECEEAAEAPAPEAGEIHAAAEPAPDTDPEDGDALCEERPGGIEYLITADPRTGKPALVLDDEEGEPMFFSVEIARRALQDTEFFDANPELKKIFMDFVNRADSS